MTEKIYRYIDCERLWLYGRSSTPVSDIWHNFVGKNDAKWQCEKGKIKTEEAKGKENR